MYKVLLVDDEEMVTQGLSRFVPWQEEGYVVAGTATSVARALAFLENEMVDLVITDVLMPVQTGIDLIRILREQYPAVKTVILSGYSEFSYTQQALRLGALDYLTKPVNFAAFKALLQKTRALLDSERRESGGDSRMREALAHTLIMNYANGYPFDPARACTCLDVTCPITVVRAASRLRAPLDASLAERFRSRFPRCRTFFPLAEEMMAVLEGDQLQEALYAALDAFVCAEAPSVPLCVGVSDPQAGYGGLRTAALQAIRAMRYQSARSSAGVMLYARVRDLYPHFGEESEAALREMTELLAAPEKRTQLAPAFSAALSALETQPGFSLAQAQRFCTKVLVELDAPIQRLALPNYPRHALLSEALMDVMGAKSMPVLSGYMAQYLRQLTDHMAGLDETEAAGELIDRVRDYIQAHFAENLTLSVLSELFYVSPVYLSRLFKRKTGTNFVEYLTDLRIRKAKEYLKDPRLKVYHVAEMVGYENPRYFARLFKEATGLSPQEYRDK